MNTLHFISGPWRVVYLLGRELRNRKNALARATVLLLKFLLCYSRFLLAMSTCSRFSDGLRLTLITLLLIPWWHAIAGFAASPDLPNVPSRFLLGREPILSDFDSDNKLDQATLSSEGSLKRIHIGFGKSAWSSLTFDSTVAEPGGLFSGDIDDDGDIDLVWIAESSGKSVTWLGDGHGNFSLDRHKKVDVVALLGNAHPRLNDNESGQEAQAALPTTILLVPRTFEYHPYLPCRPVTLANDTPAASMPFLALVQERGPPSQLS
jgi:hypothetical protein